MSNSDNIQVIIRSLEQRIARCDDDFEVALLEHELDEYYDLFEWVSLVEHVYDD